MLKTKGKTISYPKPGLSSSQKTGSPQSKIYVSQKGAYIAIKESSYYSSNLSKRKEHSFPQIKQILTSDPELLSVGLKNQTRTDIPVELANIVEAVEQSRYILELEDDWDDEGSKGYQPLVWERVVIFLIRLSEKALDSFNIVLDAPRIYQGPEGSIDLLWHTDNYHLLVNFPEDENSPGSFYGDNFNTETFEGTFNPLEAHCSLLAFLVWAKDKCTQ